MKTSVPPAYKIEPESTVVEVSKNNNANEQPPEPKFCCFKARDYILFVQIFTSLEPIDRFKSYILFAVFDAVSDEYDLTITKMILSVILLTAATLGIVAVQRKSYGIFAICVALEMLWFTYSFVTECIEATKVQYYTLPWDTDIPYAAYLVMFSLSVIFFFFMPVIKYARFLRATRTNSTPPSLKSKFLTVLY